MLSESPAENLARALGEDCMGRAAPRPLAGQWAALAFGRSMSFCWKIWSTFDTVQYSTRPAGKFRNIKVKMNGMTNIIFACRGSPVVGVIFCWMNIVTPMRIGRTYVGSWLARSQIQR